jgi:hypothetical protein
MDPFRGYRSQSVNAESILKGTLASFQLLFRGKVYLAVVKVGHH